MQQESFVETKAEEIIDMRVSRPAKRKKVGCIFVLIFISLA